MWQRSHGAEKGTLLVRALCVVATFHFVCLAWVFFRAPSFAHATLVLGRITRHSLGYANLAPKVLLVLAGGFVLHWVPNAWAERARELFVRTPAAVQGLLLAAAAYGIHLAASAKAQPFVYGQF
jgi:hypothetical protein